MQEEHEETNPQRRLGTGMYVMAWLVFGGLLVFFFSDVLDKQRNPNQSVSTNYGADGAREVVLQRNRAGHYVTDGYINGEPVVFLLDTGATGVAIPERIARRLELPRGRAVQTQTANGTAVAYATRLQSVRVGDIELQGVAAAISPGLKMNEVLLGMSFLRHIEFTQRGNTLILKQI